MIVILQVPGKNNNSLTIYNEYQFRTKYSVRRTVFFIYVTIHVSIDDQTVEILSYV